MHLDDSLISTERYRALIDVLMVMPEGIAVFDQTDRLRFSTQKFQESFASAADSIALGMTFESIMRRVVENGVVRLNGRTAENFIRERVEDHRYARAGSDIQLFDGR